MPSTPGSNSLPEPGRNRWPGVGNLTVGCSKVPSRPEVDKCQTLCSHPPPTWHLEAWRLLSAKGHGNICGFQRMKWVSGPGSQPLLFADPQPNPGNAPPCPDHPHLLWAGDTAVSPGSPGIPVLGHRPALPSRQRQEGGQHHGLGAGLRSLPRGPHSSLWSGRHCGQSFSSRTPSGAHTQGSWVSHCHLASWVRSMSRTWA